VRCAHGRRSDESPVFSLNVKINRSASWKHLIYAVCALAGSLLLFFRGYDIISWRAAGYLYLFEAAASRVLSILSGKRVTNILLLVIWLPLLLYEDGTLPATMAVLILQSFQWVLAVAFSRIRMDILKDILKRTYAAEILFGIVLLIVSISVVLPAIEPGIADFGDALWYCFAIVTTIGFGDISAVSVPGRILSVILGIYGIIVVALVTSIIVNFYGEMKKAEDKGRKTEGGNSDGEEAEDSAL